jgi:hypothetical protein
MASEEFRKALERSREVKITVTGRKSGREISLPVWFASDREELYLVPVTGSDSAWYKNVLKAPSIRLAAAGATWHNGNPNRGSREGRADPRNSGRHTAIGMWRRTTQITMSRWRSRSPERLGGDKLDGMERLDETNSPPSSRADEPPVRPRSQHSEARTTERRVRRAACGCVEESADYGCVKGTAVLGAQRATWNGSDAEDPTVKCPRLRKQQGAGATSSSSPGG